MIDLLIKAGIAVAILKYLFGAENMLSMGVAMLIIMFVPAICNALCQADNYFTGGSYEKE